MSVISMFPASHKDNASQASERRIGHTEFTKFKMLLQLTIFIEREIEECSKKHIFTNFDYSMDT